MTRLFSFGLVLLAIGGAAAQEDWYEPTTLTCVVDDARWVDPTPTSSIGETGPTTTFPSIFRLKRGWIKDEDGSISTQKAMITFPNDDSCSFFGGVGQNVASWNCGMLTFGTNPKVYWTKVEETKGEWAEVGVAAFVAEATCLKDES